MTRENFLKGIAGVQIAMSKEYNPEMLDVIYGMISDIGDKAFLSACRKICNVEEQFYPSTNIMALIRKEADEISNPRLSGVEAWEQVLKVSDNLPAQKKLDKNILRAFESLGLEWHTLVPGGGFALPADKINYIRRDFINFFEQMVDSDKKNDDRQLFEDERQEFIEG